MTALVKARSPYGVLSGHRRGFPFWRNICTSTCVYSILACKVGGSGLIGGSVFPLPVWHNITSRGAVSPQVGGYHRADA